MGIVIYVIMTATAFLGYVLPWGQMSFWAAAVITNFISVSGEEYCCLDFRWMGGL